MRRLFIQQGKDPACQRLIPKGFQGFQCGRANLRVGAAQAFPHQIHRTRIADQTNHLDQAALAEIDLILQGFAQKSHGPTGCR